MLSSAAADAAAATRTQAPMLPRSRGFSSRTTGAGRASPCEHGGQVHRRPARDRDHAGVGRQRHELREQLRADDAGPLGQRLAHVGGQLPGERQQRLEVRRDEQLDLGAEAQRVLDGVEAFEHGLLRVAPRAPEARDERPVLHAPMIACPALS